MASGEHLSILKRGAAAWNRWREEHPETGPDLSGAHLLLAGLSGANLVEVNLIGADLSGANLMEANLRAADLSGANLTRANLSAADLRWAKLSRANLTKADLIGAFLMGANLRAADLSGANLTRAKLSVADLSGADLIRAKLSVADLSGADLRWADLSEADLRGADLSCAIMVETNLEGATLRDCTVYGLSGWGLKLKGAVQTGLTITHRDEPTITVDSLEVAQFIYLLLNNESIRDVMDTISRKVVLILGRFPPERKAILDAIREELRQRDYLPVLFDLDKPATRDLTETVRTLAHLSRFIIADITGPRSIPHELQAIVPGLAVPIQPLLQEGSSGAYDMFRDLEEYAWVLGVHHYRATDDLRECLEDKVLKPAEEKAKELEHGGSSAAD
jgi:uncharacterized protein YjbI with pentapeptide repeats